MDTSRFRFRRAADFTALRLGRAVLGYLVLITAIITLAPFHFATRPVHGLTALWTWSDLVMNVLMFVPFGFVYQLTRPRGAPPDWPRVVVLAGAASGLIEAVQLFSPERFSSLLDVATNVTGAAVGAWLVDRLSDRLDGERAVDSLALELPLMGLVYQLVPLCWLIGLGSAGSMRRALLLPVAAIAGAVLGTVHGAYITLASSDDRRWIVGMTLGWVTVAIVPGARGDIELVIIGATLAIGAALLRCITTYRDHHADRTRRFELPTLRLILPLFAAYLVASALWSSQGWPIVARDASWQMTLALAPRGVALSQPMVYRILEHVAAFTMVGYIIAEFYGRRSRALRDTAPRVLVWSGALSIGLQVVRGYIPAYGASALMWGVTTGAALAGGWLYLLQRDHVRALVERRTLLAARSLAAAASAKIVPIATPSASAAGRSAPRRRPRVPSAGWSRP